MSEFAGRVVLVTGVSSADTDPGVLVDTFNGTKWAGPAFLHEGVTATIEKANAETLVLVQIESAAGLDAVDEIAAVDGVDVLWIGHFDLTASLGIAGDFAHPRYHEAIDRVLAAGVRARKPVGMVCNTVQEGVGLVERGFRILAFAIDVYLYEDALRAGMEGLRTSLTGRGT